MIDFRYHLVSLIAVFLAVALGIIIGTTALNEPILADIEGQVAELEQDKRSLEDRTPAAAGAGSTPPRRSTRPSPRPSSTAPSPAPRCCSSSPTRRSRRRPWNRVAALVGEAGGTVTGTITLLPAYSDPSTEAALQGYVTGGGLPSGVQLPEADDAGQLVGALLAQVLMVPPGGTAPDAAPISSVLAGLSALDVLSQDSDAVAPADYAIVLASGAFTGDDAAERSGTLVDLASALDAAGSGAVVSGDAASAAETGLVGVIRADPELSAAISTVDNVDAAAGRISTILALGQEGEGTSGKYGTGEDTQPVPPVPTTTP